MLRKMMVALALVLVPAAASNLAPMGAAAETGLSNYQVVVRAGLLGDNSDIAGAIVTIDGVRGSFVTGADGKTPIIKVPTGTHTIHVVAKGWQPADMEGVVLRTPTDYTTDIYLSRGSGRKHLNDNVPRRTKSQTPKKAEEVPAGDVAPMAPDIRPFQAPTQVKACDQNGANCSYIPTETLVQYSLWKEWGDAVPSSYWSTNWPVEALKVGSVAIRSWLYYNAASNWPPCKHQDCSVWNSEVDLVWQTTQPESRTRYDTAR